MYISTVVFKDAVVALNLKRNIKSCKNFKEICDHLIFKFFLKGVSSLLLKKKEIVI